MSNKLYVIASPIGNINDCSRNMIDVLENIDYLFCEDTRNTSKLLALLKIKNKPKLISYHKFNEHSTIDNILNQISKFKCGLISDAGYPGISDPGYLLINECHKKNIIVSIVDGPCALIHAVVQSGFCSKGFIFIGFLSNTKKDIIESIKKQKHNNLPIVCYESVHRINKTLKILKENFSDCKIYIGRELTKKFEEYIIDDIDNIDDVNEKGEFTLVINFNNDCTNNNLNYDKLYNDLVDLVSLGLKYKNACKFVAKTNNVSANDIYKKFLDKFS